MRTQLQQVSIAIVTKKRRKSLTELLRSLLTQPHIHEVKRIFVLENQVESFTNKERTFFSKKLKNIFFHFLQSSKVETRNLAIQLCKTRYLIFLDDDVTVSPQWLKTVEKILSEKKNKERIVFYQGSYDEVYRKKLPILAKEAIRQYEYFGYDSIIQSSSSLLRFSLDTKNVLLDAYFLKKHHLSFDSIFDQYGFSEDTDLGFHIYQEGGAGEYVPTLHVRHHKPLSIKKMFFLSQQSGRAYGLFCRKNKLSFSLKGQIIHTFHIVLFLLKNKNINIKNKIEVSFWAVLYRSIFTVNILHS